MSTGTEQDRRFSPRKVLRAHGSLALEGKAPMEIDVLDIALGSICISVSLQLAPGQRCHLHFSPLLNGKRHDITLTAKVIHCVCGSHGFRAGLQFVDIDAADLAPITAYMGTY